MRVDEPLKFLQFRSLGDDDVLGHRIDGAGHVDGGAVRGDDAGVDRIQRREMLLRRGPPQLVVVPRAILLDGVGRAVGRTTEVEIRSANSSA